uniref:FLZ-type domain-containing protein n=1 Tax=Peronospora matthiolae TaxID=2874970 RepID=A0AAV1U049_9STRA
MIQFIFRRRKRTQHEPSKSWPGRDDCVAVVEPVPASRPPASTSIAIPSSSSVSRKLTPDRVPRQRSADEGTHRTGSWRQRQTYCANCQRLFFTSLSSLRSIAGAFCSLDCKTNLEYIHQIQDVTFKQTWESSTISSGLEDAMYETKANTSRVITGVDDLDRFGPRASCIGSQIDVVTSDGEGYTRRDRW